MTGWHGWGDEGEVVNQPQKIDALAVIQSVSPVIQSIAEEFSDPFRRVAVLEAKLENARARGASTSKIRLLEAKLDAAQRAAGIRVESEERTRVWAGLGQTAILAAVGVGGALTLFLVLKAVR